MDDTGRPGMSTPPGEIRASAAGTAADGAAAHGTSGSAAYSAVGASALLPGEGAEAARALAADAALRDRLRVHWRKTRILTAALLFLWLLVTLGVGVFARQLEHIRFFGWPLSYYMGAQGALIVFLLIIGCYALVMNRLDREALGDHGAADAAKFRESH